MATITSTIKLVDQMTPTLNKISKAIDTISKKSANIGRSMETSANRANNAIAKSTANRVNNDIAKLTEEDRFDRKIWHAQLERERLLQAEENRLRKEKEAAERAHTDLLIRNARIEEKIKKQIEREELAAKKQADREELAAKKAAERETLALEREAARVAKQLAREEAQAKKAAEREALNAKRQAEREALTAAKERVAMERKIAQMNAQYGNAMIKYTGLVNYKQNQFNSTLGKTRSAANGVLSVFRRILATLGLILGVRSMVEVADTMMNANARITNITGDLEKTKYYMDAIYESAQRSRSEFMNTANSVGKLATLAGSAFDGSMEEVIAFTELMNKLFVISGASAAEASNAMYQLTQAMAAGKLQGDEMRSIMENAPMLAQKIADKLGVTVGEVKELGAEGKITADVIKEALFGAADDIEEKFENMPKTIGQTWTEISNHALNAFRPVIDRVQQFINSPTFENFKQKVLRIITAISDAVIRLFDVFETPRMQNAIGKICGALSTLWEIASWIGNALVNVARWICDNWGAISPIIYTIAWAFLAYKAAIAIATVAMWAYNAAQFVAGLIAGTVVLTTFGWVLLIIVAIVAIIYGAVAAWNHFTNSTVSATGIIFGAIAFVIACIWDLVVGLWDVLGTCVHAVVYLAKLLWQIFVDLCEFIAILIVDIIAFCINLVSAICTAVVEVGGRLWDTFLWIIEICKIVLSNIGKFLGNLLLAIGKSIIEIGNNIWNTFVWLGAVISTWASNISIGMSQLCENLPAYWEYFKAAVAEKFWSIVSTVVNAFNNMIQNARDMCVKMLTPFADFANGVKNIINGIKELWNGLAEKMSVGINVPNGVREAIKYLGGGDIGSRIGITVPKFEINRDPITAEGWIGAIGGLADTVTGKHLAAKQALESAKNNITDVNWSTNALPEYSEYVNWGSVIDGWNEGMNSFEYDSLPEYSVDWDGVWGKIKDAFNTIEYENPLDAFAGEDYKKDWEEFMAALERTWNWEDYVNPFEAFKNWYKKGESIEDGITGLIDGVGALIDGLFGDGKDPNALIPELPGGGSGNGELPQSLEDLLSGHTPSDDVLGAIKDNTGSTAGSAGNIEDTLDLAEEELELLRKLAEQEVINRFTTAEIHVDMTNNNNISSDMDLDGIVTHLSTKLYEELGVVASGVHY